MVNPARTDPRRRRCGGDIRLIAFITDPGPIRKILTHLGEPLEPPPVSPARGPPTEWVELVQVHDDRDVFQASSDEMPAIDIHSCERRSKSAARWWDSVDDRVDDQGLRDAIDSTMEGLRIATDGKNLPMLHYAAQMDLDLVDLLEGYFEDEDAAAE